MNHDKINKFFKYILLISFITFSALYISQAVGYFDYKNSKKVSLTNQQIKKFEKDVKNGKNVDIKKYIDENTNNYQNKLSKVGVSISSTTEKIIQKIINETFKVLSKLVGE